MTKEDQIIASLSRIEQSQVDLKDRLYDRDGDIPEIKSRLRNGDVKFEDHEKRIGIIESIKDLPRNGRFGRRKVVIGGGTASLISLVIYGVGRLAGFW